MPVCGRINLKLSPTELAEFFSLFREPEWSPRYNLGPMQSILVVRLKPGGIREMDPLQWGLVPSWSRDAASGSIMTLARSDTITDKPAFRDAVGSRRCLIPASGFYEWQHISGKSKQPWHIFRRDGLPFAFAGIWETWKRPDGGLLESCAIITTDANPFMSELGDRMPVMLAESDWDIWLQGKALRPKILTDLLVPNNVIELEKTPVSTFVNSVKNDSPECIRPVPKPRTLF